MKNEDILESVKRIFAQYRKLAERSMAQVNDEALFRAANDDSNSVAVICKHLAGNMLSRWTEFRTTDGEKEWRNRDDEFVNGFTTRNEVMDYWNKGWECFEAALNSIIPEELEDTIYIRAEAHTIFEAINRQMAHYSYHIGQIVLLCKMYKPTAWDSLTIPRNQSAAFNADKMQKG